MTNDELLDRYVKENAESAFAALVKRHLNLVYSTALRHVRSPHLAEEVAQSVFIDLARQGGRIKAGTPLVAWLHLVARRRAVDAIRRESRRRINESNAAAMNANTEASDGAPPWAEIERYLDEAVESLRPADRAAVLLRFFDDKSFQDVAKELGTSDDAAQKRVTRALEQVRQFLAKRGVQASVAGLSGSLATNAMQPAPAALSSTIIAAGLGKAPALLGLVSPLSDIAMTTTHKVLVGTFFTAAIAGGIFQGLEIIRLKADLRQQSQNFQSQVASLRAEREAEKKAFDAAVRALDAERLKHAPLLSQDPQSESALDAWLQKVVSLKKHLEQHPRYQIPELALLEDKDWLDVTKDIQLADEWDYRSALAELRKLAKEHFFRLVQPAMAGYLKASRGVPPSDPSAFVAFMRTPVDATIWQRYQIVPSSQISSDEFTWPGPAEIHPVWVMTERTRIDDYFDTIFYVAENAAASTSTGKINRELVQAYRQFAAAHPNQRATNAADLAPYIHSPIDPSFIDRDIKKNR